MRSVSGLDRKRRSFRSLFRRIGVPAAAIAALIAVSALPAGAQVFGKGDGAVSGFSGSALPPGGLAPGADPLSQSVIDPEGATLRIFDFSNMQGPPAGAIVPLATKFELKANQIGQVFGLAFQEGQTPALFAGATSAFGLNIVGPGGEKLQTGAAGASFAPGQFGQALGGGPGAIWRVDAATGEVKLFAKTALNGAENAGPGIGDVTFDAASQSVFASDLDTGMIHRFDLNGADTAQFDHGVTGRPTQNEPALRDDGRRGAIDTAEFKPADPESWGFTPAGRRVMALAMRQGRLFYSIAEPSQIWSVGVGPDGAFLGDPRLEAEAPEDAQNPIADLAFDELGRLYAAQRGKQQAGADFSKFAEPITSGVLRFLPGEGGAGFTLDGEEFPIGLREPHKMSVGGLSMAPAFDEQGQIIPGSCGKSLAVTGDHLTDVGTGRINPAAPGAVHGVQITADVDGAREKPPLKTYFTHFNEAQDDPIFGGHVGDVEILQNCEPQAAEAAPAGEAPPPFPGPAPFPAEPIDPGAPFDPIGPGEQPDPEDPNTPNLAIDKVAGVCSIGQGDKIECPFTITVTNTGPVPFVGPISVDETLGFDRGNLTFDGPFLCTPKPGGTGAADCVLPDNNIPPGESVSFNVTTNIAQGDKASAPCLLSNTAILIAGPGNDVPQDDAATTTVDTTDINPQCVPAPDPALVDPNTPNLAITKTAGACSIGQGDKVVCPFTITVTNTGPVTFVGPISVDETLGFDRGNLTFEGPFVCTPKPGGTGAADCLRPAANIPPGESVSFTATTNIAQGDKASAPCSLSNTATLTAGAGNDAPQDDAATTTVDITDVNPNCKKPGNLAISKAAKNTCVKLEAQKQWKCDFDIVITNTGESDFTGPVTITEQTDRNTVTTFNVGFDCDAQDINAGQTELTCKTQDDFTIAAGASEAFVVSSFIPFDAFPVDTPVGECVLRNTISIAEPAEGGPDAANADAADDIAEAIQILPAVPNKGKAIPCDPPSLEVKKTPVGECVQGAGGWSCKFKITVKSVGPDPFQEAPIEIAEILPDGATLTSFSPPWNCAGTTGVVTCTHPETTLAVGAFAPDLEVTVTIPDSAVKSGQCNVVNTARLKTVAGLDKPSDPQYTSTATARVASPNCKAPIALPRPVAPERPRMPLTIAKSGDATCKAGEYCRFTLIVTNPGGAPFSGPVTIADGMSLPGSANGPGAKVVSISPPLGCASQPSALPFNCTAQMRLGAGEARVFTVTVEAPGNAGAAGAAGPTSLRNCAVIADPSMPERLRALQAQGQSGRASPAPGGARGGSYSCHDFQVTPKPQGCQGGLVLNSAGRCECPPGSEWKGRMCLTKVEPTPLPTGVCPPYTSGNWPACKAIECPAGTYGRFPNCKSAVTPECPAYTTGDYPNCKPIACPRGTYGAFPNCRPVITDKYCPDGSRVPAGRACPTLPCPDGTYGRHPNCKPVVIPPCPAGTYGRYPNCKPVVIPPCPAGTYGRYPNCKYDEPRYKRCPDGSRIPETVACPTTQGPRCYGDFVPTGRGGCACPAGQTPIGRSFQCKPTGGIDEPAYKRCPDGSRVPVTVACPSVGPRCMGDFVPTGRGGCACPAGQTPIGRSFRCKPAGASGEDRCYFGRIRTPQGCVCPAGTSGGRYGPCRGGSTTQEPQRCYGGRIRTPQGCVCPAGTFGGRYGPCRRAEPQPKPDVYNCGPNMRYSRSQRRCVPLYDNQSGPSLRDRLRDRYRQQQQLQQRDQLRQNWRERFRDRYRQQQQQQQPNYNWRERYRRYRQNQGPVVR